MFRHLPLLLVLIFGALPLRAQETEISTTILLAGGEYVNKSAWGGRLFAALGSQYIQVSPFSWSFVRDPGNGEVRLSVNPIASLPFLAAVVGEWDMSLPIILPLLPQALSNLSLQAPIVSRYLYATVGQRTDFYLLCDNSRIYTEGYVGLRLFSGEDLGLSGEVRYVWPITRGYLEDRRPYVGVALSLAIVRYDDGLVPLTPLSLLP